MTAAIEPEAPAGVIRIFLCDDTPEVRKRVRRALSADAGFEVVGEAGDPVEGLPLIGDLQPDVVVLDLSMPRMDGLEAIEHVERQAPGAGIVIFSGFLGEALADTATALGADRFVEKSVPLAELVEVVREVHARRRAGEKPVKREVPREQETRTAVALQTSTTADLESPPIPIDVYGERTVIGAAAACVLVAGGVIALTGLAPGALMALYLIPIMATAGRSTIVPSVAIAVLAGATYTVSSEIGGYDLPLEVTIGSLTAFLVLGIGANRTMAWVRARSQRRTELTRELQRSNAELEQFAYIASHDLAEPLRSISALAGMLERKYAGALGDDADKFLGHITAGTDRMQVMIDDLLAFGRAGRLSPADRPFELGVVVQTVRESLATAIEERDASVRAIGTLPAVYGDEGRVGQVMQNLVANAIKFTPADRTPDVRISAMRVHDAWRVDIRDNGIGIDPRFAHKVFGMFQRLHGREEYDGTGIGLAICQRIIERHGGRIWVDSLEGEGSTFSFTLPDPD